MTVITTLFTNSCTVHASDSLLTTQQPDGSFKSHEFRESKIISVDRYRGAMSYFGLASYGNFNTHDWLLGQRSNTISKTAEKYAEFISTELTNTYRQLGILNNFNSGLGIHFSCYECIDGEYFPELFFITNYFTVGKVNPEGFIYTRDTYKTLKKCAPDPSHRDKQYRMQVKKYINSAGLIWFNNGDSVLFNSAANAIFNAFMTLKSRGYLIQPFGPKECRNLARRPVEIVKNVQRDFCDSKKRLVGGKIHDLSITPNGQYESSTGDI